MPHTVLPAEWEAQDAILLTWPHAESDWRSWLDQADHTFATLATVISRYQTLIISCFDTAHCQHVHDLLAVCGADLERCRLYAVPSNDTWVRDHGAISVYRNGQAVLLDFRFNGWGGKFASALDHQITERLHALGALGATPRQAIDLILEGGGIESDGQGTLLTTAHCLLNPNRNGLSQAQMEQRLSEILGFERFLWLHNGYLLGDDTDSHIDTLARFCDPHTIVYQGCQDANDPHFASLQAMAEELRTFRTIENQGYRLVELPLPAARYDAHHQRLPASYANFLILNDAVLVPTYDVPQDQIALAQLRHCFPQRDVSGIDCTTLIHQYGSLHCVTMQLPAGILREKTEDCVCGSL